MKCFHHRDSITVVVKIEQVQGVLRQLAMTQQIVRIFKENIIHCQIPRQQHPGPLPAKNPRRQMIDKHQHLSRGFYIPQSGLGLSHSQPGIHI